MQKTYFNFYFLLYIFSFSTRRQTIGHNFIVSVSDGALTVLSLPAQLNCQVMKNERTQGQ